MAGAAWAGQADGPVFVPTAWTIGAAGSGRRNLECNANNTGWCRAAPGLSRLLVRGKTEDW